MHTECLVEAGSDASVGIEFRFLQLVFRRTEPSAQPSLASEPSSCFGQELKERSDEGVERTVELEFSLNAKLQPIDFRFPRPNQHEQPPDANTQRTSQTSANELRGKISVDTEVIRDGVWKLKIDVANTSPLPISSLDRNSALRQSLLSAHMILTASKANFISLLDPPQHLQNAATACVNVGNFPVLVGSNGERDMLLCSPILLYDYPQIAPESDGDFYDATEMDEMLTLRVMTLTDQEKDEMRLAEDRVRNLLQRTEQSAREQLMRTHGTIRGLRQIEETK